MPILNGPSRAPHAGGAPDSLAIMLHGLGANGSDLIGLSMALSPRFPHMAFHAPDAPDPYVEAGFGLRWFPIEPPEARETGLRKAGEIVEAYVGELLDEYGLTPDRCVLIGFSQGCMTSLHTAPRMERPVAGVVGFSGRLLFPEWLAGEARHKLPIVLVHGDDDPVVPLQALADAGQTLADLDFPVEAYLLPGLGHSIDVRGLEIAERFIARVLGKADGAEQ